MSIYIYISWHKCHESRSCPIPTISSWISSTLHDPRLRTGNSTVRSTASPNRRPWAQHASKMVLDIDWDSMSHILSSPSWLSFDIPCLSSTCRYSNMLPQPIGLQIYTMYSYSHSMFAIFQIWSKTAVEVRGFPGRKGWRTPPQPPSSHGSSRAPSESRPTSGLGPEDPRNLGSRRMNDFRNMCDIYIYTYIQTYTYTCIYI